MERLVDADSVAIRNAAGLAEPFKTQLPVAVDRQSGSLMREIPAS
jgi:hypothetical protein